MNNASTAPRSVRSATIVHVTKAAKRRLRWYKVVRWDFSEVLVEATSHDAARNKGALYFICAGNKRWPHVRSCKLQRGMNG